MNPSVPPSIDPTPQVSQLVAQGWEIVSDGPSGVQLRAPRKMRGLDKAALILGAVLVFAYGVGLILVAAALIDYYALTPRETRFIAR